MSFGLIDGNPHDRFLRRAQNSFCKKQQLQQQQQQQQQQQKQQYLKIIYF
jgi:hypothetical protein